MYATPQNRLQLSRQHRIRLPVRSPFPSPNDMLITNRRSCPWCFTDYAVDIVPDSAPGRRKGRLLVFTTWKYLSDGSASRRWHWTTHQTSGRPERFYPPGQIYQSFEDDHKYKMDVAEIQQCVASARESRREAPPKCADVVEPGSWVIQMEKGE